MGEFDPPQMEVTIVHRDREWFEKNLPVFQKFISDLNEKKENLSSTVEYMLEDEEPKEPKPKKRKKNEFSEECLIVEDETWE